MNEIVDTRLVKHGAGLTFWLWTTKRKRPLKVTLGYAYGDPHVEAWLQMVARLIAERLLPEVTGQAKRQIPWTTRASITSKKIEVRKRSLFGTKTVEIPLDRPLAYQFSQTLAWVTLSNDNGEQADVPTYEKGFHPGFHLAKKIAPVIPPAEDRIEDE